MNAKLIFILFVFNGHRICAATVADSWIRFGKSLKDSWLNCSEDVNLGMFQCLKVSSLELFDKMIESDVIPLTDDARLVRSEYSRKISFNSDANIHNEVWQKQDKLSVSWAEHVLTKLYNVFQSHTLHIDIIPKSTGRGRHRHRHNMLPMMAFGMTAAGLVMAPFGFQFLAVLAGKALLLSKMALLLATVNGLKKVASSGVHYGLYHANSHHGHHVWDRGDTERPRSQ